MVLSTFHLGAGLSEQAPAIPGAQELLPPRDLRPDLRQITSQPAAPAFGAPRAEPSGRSETLGYPAAPAAPAALPSAPSTPAAPTVSASVASTPSRLKAPGIPIGKGVPVGARPKSPSAFEL